MPRGECFSVVQTGRASERAGPRASCSIPPPQRGELSPTINHIFLCGCGFFLEITIWVKFVNSFGMTELLLGENLQFPSKKLLRATC